MGHTIEAASSGRAGCRGCGEKIARGELRFGERLPNPFADDAEMTIWFHLPCGAFKRPEAFLETLESHDGTIEDRELLTSRARSGLDHPRLPRVDGAERAPTGRAKCRSCHEKIEKDTWRIRLVFFEDGRFQPSGNIHAACALEYLGTIDLLDRIDHFGPDIGVEDRGALESALSND